jgi:hypothetical protein
MQHVGAVHQIEDGGASDQKSDSCRVAQATGLFWCGFCLHLIEVKDKSDPWAARFTHVENHFFGRNNQPKKDISDWQSISQVNAAAELQLSKDNPSAKAEKRKPSPAEGPAPKKPRQGKAVGFWFCVRLASAQLLLTRQPLLTSKL